MKKAFFYFSIIIVISLKVQAQTYTIKGRVVEYGTGAPISYALISIKGTGYGTETNDSGYYSFNAPIRFKDSLTAEFIGYKKKRKALVPPKEGTTLVLNFLMLPDETMIEEIVVTVHENPAFPIMRNVIAHKNQNDPRRLLSYQYENYSKMELSIDNLGEKMQKKKFMKAITRELAKDSLTLEKGEDGKPVVPIMFSETISMVYRNKEGLRTKEELLAVKNSNIGLASGKIVKPLLSSTYQESNFYLNRINILQTDFQSPIADGWQLLYEYELVDTVFIDGDSCFQLNVRPKNPRDLAFTGTIWIADSSFALKQLTLFTNEKTKLNFVESIRIFQLNKKTANSAWLPAKTRIELDLSNITHWKLGILAKLTTYSQGFLVDQPMSPKFFDENLVENEDTYDRGIEMPALRKDTLTQYEKNFQQSIKTISNVPAIKRYVTLANIGSTGYWRLGKIEVGHVLGVLNNNNIEGVRLSLGFRTNASFSRKIVFKGYTAYGFYDQRLKYMAGVDYIINRRPWTVVGFEHRYDMDQVGVNAEILSNNQIFYAFTKNGTMRGPYYNYSNFAYFQTDLKKGVTERIGIRQRDFNPAYAFEYYSTTTDDYSFVANKFQITEIISDTRWAKDEFRFIEGNNRVSNGARKWPIVSFRNVVGLKDVMNSSFNYYKASISLSHNFAMGILGRTYYDVYAGKIFGTVPYPILETHMGNQSYFYSSVAFNQMDYFEFISDTYATLRFRHYFGGLFFNRIPLIQRFKWGFFTTSNLAFGSMSDKNYSLIPAYDVYGDPLRTFYTLNSKPYWEVGYGIENIFKLLRVDFVHRLSYLDHPDVRKFGIKVSFQISL